eukprot:508365_1
MSDIKKAIRAKNRRRRLKAAKKKGLLPYRRSRSTKQHLFQLAVIMIALFCYKQFSKSPIHCKDAADPLCPDKYFNNNYTNARAQFLSLSSTIKNANTYHLPIYQLKNGNYLYTDITIINEQSKSNHLIIHVSGTHGVEGYAGSAIQLSLLEYISNITNNQHTSYLFENYTFTNSEECTAENNAPIIIFIHAFNPYGFHFGRRTNENNVDLNRNYKTKSEWDELVSKDKNVFGYQDLNALFNPKYDLKSLSDSGLAHYWLPYYYYSVFPRALYYLATVGRLKMKSSMLIGQCFDMNGLQYNGKPYTLEKSHEMLEDFIMNKLFEEKHSEWKTQINKISFIDVHTGLGTYGVDTLIGNNENDIHKINMLMSEHLKKELIVNARSSFDGYNNVNGYLMDLISNLIESKWNDKQDIIDSLVMVEEFGTYREGLILAGLRLENGITNGYNEYIEKRESVNKEMLENVNDVLNRTRKIFKDVFYVERVDWKTQIVKRGFNLFAQVYNR